MYVIKNPCCILFKMQQGHSITYSQAYLRLFRMRRRGILNLSVRLVYGSHKPRHLLKFRQDRLSVNI